MAITAAFGKEPEEVPATATEPALGTGGGLPHELKLVAGGGTEGNDLCGGTPEGFGGVEDDEVLATGAEYDNAFLVGWILGGSGTDEGLMEGGDCEGRAGDEALAFSSGPCPWSIVTGPPVCHFCFLPPPLAAGEPALRFSPWPCFMGQS